MGVGVHGCGSRLSNRFQGWSTGNQHYAFFGGCFLDDRTYLPCIGLYVEGSKVAPLRFYPWVFGALFGGPFSGTYKAQVGLHQGGTRKPIQDYNLKGTATQGPLAVDMDAFGT